MYNAGTACPCGLGCDSTKNIFYPRAIVLQGDTMHTCVGLYAQHGIMHDAWNWSVSAAEGGSKFSHEIIYVITTTLS